jgi:hypothetical protein
VRVEGSRAVTYGAMQSGKLCTEILHEHTGLYLQGLKVSEDGDMFLKRMPFTGMWRRIGILLTDVSEERITCIFRVEEIHER